MRRRLGALAAIGLALCARPAHAQRTKAQCAEAYTGAQELRLVHRPRASLEKAYVCAAEGCPEWMRTECGQWIAESQAAIPSIVIVIRDEQGQPFAPAGRLVVDDVEVDMATAERPTDLDPGEHAVRLEIAGRPPVEVRLRLREGEKSRRVVLTAPRPEGEAPTAKAPPPPVAPPRPEAATRPIPWTVYATGGAAVVGAAVFAGFGVSGVSARDDLYACRPNCPQERVDEVSRSFTVASVALGVSLAVLTASTVLYLTRPSRASTPRGTALLRF